jgi:carbonic anhydrase
LSPAVERASGHEHDADRHETVERASVLLSMERLMSYPFVASRVEAKALAVNGARFGIADGRLEIYDHAAGVFVAV